jgi:hypothetical protein
MMRPKATAAPLTSSAHQIVPVQKKKKKTKKENEKKKKKNETYRGSVAMDSLDHRALEPVARALSSGTCSQTSELGDSSLDLRAQGHDAKPPSSGTHS